MSFDSISSSSSSIFAASNANDLAEKKRGNHSAELEQDKLDVRCQQWVSQVKIEGCEEERSGGGEIDVLPMHVCNGRDQATRALEVTSDSDLLSDRSIVESNCSGTNLNGSSSGTFYSRNISEVEDGGDLDDWEAVADALAAADDKKDQRDHRVESLGENKNVAQLDHLPEVAKQPNATVDVWKQKSENRDQKSKSEVENKDVTKLDHLSEVVNQPTAIVDFCKPKVENGQAGRRSDALQWKPKPENGQAWRNPDAFHSKQRPKNGQAWRNRDAFHWKPKPENGQAWRQGDTFCWKPKPEKRDKKSKSLEENKNVTQLDHLPELVNEPTATADVWKPKPENGQATVDVLKPKPENGQAQRHSDTFLPKTLPILQKKHNYPMKANRHYRHGGTKLGCKNLVSPPSSCPICCEDLDSTDSSFLPCSCGFQLCLFCHKRILEEDGRCPGCRKHYDNNVVQWEENSDLIVA
ncbi:hypothetical protein POM88_038912 [Heracleum sosnowskyi]|uniref:RING-type domain-containing protein n=1 Tax=Heracleum sosnowskyi TaxID=360622 RepID=A0AAD8HAH6_9APIA|nr:hypothetical protein POM88_038912 [Heracleum sosnowskyi]